MAPNHKLKLKYFDSFFTEFLSVHIIRLEVFVFYLIPIFFLKSWLFLIHYKLHIFYLFLKELNIKELNYCIFLPVFSSERTCNLDFICILL